MRGGHHHLRMDQRACADRVRAADEHRDHRRELAHARIGAPDDRQRLLGRGHEGLTREPQGQQRRRRQVQQWHVWESMAAERWILEGCAIWPRAAAIA